MTEIEDLPDAVPKHLEDKVAEKHNLNGGSKDEIKWGVIQDQLHDSDINTSEVIGEITEHYYENDHFILRDEDNEMFVYYPAEGIYRPKAESYLKQDLTNNLGFGYYDGKVKDSVMDKIGGMVIESSDDIGNTEYKLCVENGVLDISNPSKPELENHTPDYLLTSDINSPYNESDECPKWIANLKEVMPNPQDRKKFQEFAGYILHHWNNRFNRSILLLGPTQSGKSVLLHVLEEIIGTENILNKSIQRLSNNRFAISGLSGNIANIDADLGTSKLEDTGMFKKLAAGDRVTAEAKYEDPYDYQPTQKLLFSANQVPEVERADDAFYERWLFAEIPETIPREDRNPDLENELLQEKAGILNWMLEGYARLMDQSGFTGERNLADKKAMWNGYGDSIDRFIERNITEAPANEIEASKVYTMYRGEFSDTDIDTYPQKTLTERLKKEFGINAPRVSEGIEYTVYQGIDLQSQDVKEEESKSPW